MDTYPVVAAAGCWPRAFTATIGPFWVSPGRAVVG
jgi:hypothetical protein